MSTIGSTQFVMTSTSDSVWPAFNVLNIMRPMPWLSDGYCWSAISIAILKIALENCVAGPLTRKLRNWKGLVGVSVFGLLYMAER